MKSLSFYLCLKPIWNQMMHSFSLDLQWDKTMQVIHTDGMTQAQSATPIILYVK